MVREDSQLDDGGKSVAAFSSMKASLTRVVAKPNNEPNGNRVRLTYKHVAISASWPAFYRI